MVRTNKYMIVFSQWLSYKDWALGEVTSLKANFIHTI